MDRPKIRINPRTGRPFHVYRNGPGFRFDITVNGVKYRTITYSDPYTPAIKAHFDDWHLTCR